MQEFQLSRYIKKWLPWIVAVCVAATAGIYLFLSGSQTYVASAVIQYNGEGAEQGLTPLGTEIDVNEIRSSGIMSKVVANLSLENTSYSLDDYASRIMITEVLDEDEVLRKQALLDEGEEYTYKPTTYIISFEAENDEGSDFAMKLLNETLDVYFAEYSENYVNTGSVANSLSRIYEGSYDYIEMMEIIEANISETLTTLYQYGSNSPYYRAVSTGLSYNDLAGEFNLIESVNISALYSKILEYQISKDKRLLISRYQERIKNHGISNETEEKQISDVVRLIDAYVEKMRNSDNTNITYNYILDDVYSKELHDAEGAVIGYGDQTVTYDRLIYSWRDHNQNKQYALIDIAYCEYMIGEFQKDVYVGNYSSIEAEVEQEIRELVDRLIGLYAQVEATTTEYNEYVGAQNISMLSTVSVHESMKVMLYTAIAAVFLLIVCCCGAILLGRLNDIIQYVFYTDHMTGLHNRSAFDNYLDSSRKQVLGNGAACAVISILNQADINREFGREKGDGLLGIFAQNLKEVFGQMPVFLVYNGNSRFIAMVERTDASTMEYTLERFRHLVDRREFLPEADIEYEVGLAESERDEIYHMTGLLSRATASVVRYTSEGSGKKEKS